MDKEPYQKREIDYFMAELNKKLNEIHADVKDTKAQALKALVRVKLVEEWQGDAKTIIENSTERLDNLTNFRWWIIGAGATFLLLGATIATLIYKNIDNKISDGIEQAFNDRFSKVEIVNK